MPLNPYQSLVSLLLNVLDAHTVAFFIVDPRNRQLELAAAESLSKYLPDRVTLPIEQSGILSQVHKIGQTVHIDKLNEVSAPLNSMSPFYRDGESLVKSLYAIPVGDGTGVLYVDTKFQWSFNDKQQKLIREIAAILAELLTRQDRFDQRHEGGRILEFWQRLDQLNLQDPGIEESCRLAVQECAGLLGAEYAFLALREAAGAQYALLSATENFPRNLVTQRFLVNQGLIGRTLETKKMLLIAKLNPQTSDHFLFTSSEGLPHQGTLLLLPSETNLGQTLVFGFLARRPMEWTPDVQIAVAHVFRTLRLVLEEATLRKECLELRSYDLQTGFLNAPAFESRLEEAVASSMQKSVPCTLGLIQMEPWQILTTQAPPKQVRRWQRNLASTLHDRLPEGVFVGQMSENRFALLFRETTPQECDAFLARLGDLGKDLVKSKSRRFRLVPYSATAGFPQDGTRADELWVTAHQRLFATFRTRSADGRS